MKKTKLALLAMVVALGALLPCSKIMASEAILETAEAVATSEIHETVAEEESPATVSEEELEENETEVSADISVEDPAEIGIMPMWIQPPDALTIFNNGQTNYAGSSAGVYFYDYTTDAGVNAYCIDADSPPVPSGSSLPYTKLADIPEDYRRALGYAVKHSAGMSRNTIQATFHMIECLLGYTTKWNPAWAGYQNFDVAAAKQLAADAVAYRDSIVYNYPVFGITSIEANWKTDKTITINVATEYCDTWELTLPPGVTASQTTGTNTTGTTVTLTITDAAAFAASNKQISGVASVAFSPLQAITFLTHNSSYQNYIAFDLDGAGSDSDPHSRTLPDALGGFQFEKYEDWTENYLTYSNEVEFQAVLNGYTWATAPADAKATLKINSSNKYVASNLTPGTYTVTQVAGPSTQHYVDSFQVVVSAGSVNTNVPTKVNLAKWGVVQIEKWKVESTGQETREAGAEFAVYPASYTSWAAAQADLVTGSNKYKALTEIITTGATGNGVSAALPFGTYRVEQIGSSAGAAYAFADSWTVTINEHMKTYSFIKYNHRISGTAVITKLMNINGGVPEPGAKFEVFLKSAGSYAAGQAAERDIITADSQGKATTKNLPRGVYVFHQIAGAPGTVFCTDFELTIGETLNSVVTRTVMNEISKGRVEITKTTNRPGTPVEQGATFQVYIKSAGSYSAAQPSERDVITTDANGKATTQLLPYGTYVFHQTAAPEGTLPCADFEMVVGAVNNQTLTRAVVNEPQRGRIEILKTMNYGGNLVVEPGASFRVFLSAAGSYSAAQPAERDVITTDASGKAVTQLLPYGVYTFQQIAAAEGAIFCDDFELLVGDANNAVVAQNVVNEVIQGVIKVIKTDGKTLFPLEGIEFSVYDDQGNLVDKVITDVNGVATTKILFYGVYVVVETGTLDEYVLDETEYTVTIDKTPALGKNFEEYDLEVANNKKAEVQILKVTGDGTETPMQGVVFGIYNKSNDSLVVELTTDENGYAATLLIAGEYYIRELATWEGYVLLTEDILVTAEWNGIYKFKPYNDRKAEVQIFKTTGDGTETPMRGVVFGIYNKSNDSLVEELTTDENGYAATLLIAGEYYIRELATWEGYVLLTEDIPVAAEWNGIYKFKPYNDKKAEVQIFKTIGDGTETPMQGVVFGIYNKSNDSLVAELTTDENGYAATLLEAGEYYIRELATWDGYALLTEDIAVNAEWFQVYKFTPTNDKSSVTITKTDVTTGKPVKGAEITIFDKNGDEVGKYVTDENGKTVIEGLKPGKYTFKESVHPEGYILNTESFEFVVDQFGKVEGITEFSDEPTELIVTKLDRYSRKLLAGAELQLIAPDESIMRFNLIDGIYIANATGEFDRIVTGDDGTAIVRYLPAAVYQVKEVKAPEGYQLREDPVEVKIDSTHGISSPVLLDYENDLAPVRITKTGETAADIGAIIIALLSSFAMITVAIRRKRKTQVSE